MAIVKRKVNAISASVAEANIDPGGPSSMDAEERFQTRADRGLLGKKTLMMSIAQGLDEHAVDFGCNCCSFTRLRLSGGHVGSYVHPHTFWVGFFCVSRECGFAFITMDKCCRCTRTRNHDHGSMETRRCLRFRIRS